MELDRAWIGCLGGYWEALDWDAITYDCLLRVLARCRVQFDASVVELLAYGRSGLGLKHGFFVDLLLQALFFLVITWLNWVE